MSRPWNASSAISNEKLKEYPQINVKEFIKEKTMPRSIMDDFEGVKKEWDRIRGEKKDGEDQIDKANPPEPNTNQGDAEYYDPYCGYIDELLDKQDNIIVFSTKFNVIPFISRGQRYVHNPSR